MVEVLNDIVGQDAKEIEWWQMCVRASIIFVYALFLYRLIPRRAFAGSAAIDVALMIIVGSSLSRALTGNAPLFMTLWGVGFLYALYIALTAISRRSEKFSRIVKGRALVVIKDGKVIEYALAKAQLSSTDIREHLRLNGIENVENIRRACIERNGSFSFSKITEKADYTIDEKG